MGTQITIQNVRCAFPQYFVAKATVGDDGKPGTPKYSGLFILPPDHPQLKEINKIINAEAVNKWKEEAPAIMKALRIQDRICLHDGDTKTKYAGFEGNLFISANSTSRPNVFSRSKVLLQSAGDPGAPYSGCYADVSIDIYPQDHHKWGKRINAGLRGVRFRADGDAFAAGAAASEDEFADLGDQGDDTDPTA